MPSKGAPNHTCKLYRDTIYIVKLQGHFCRNEPNMYIVFKDLQNLRVLIHNREISILIFIYLCRAAEGQDIAEYAVMLAVILVLVVGTIRLIGGSANNVFSATASSIGG
jgi:Flp pilus assembly pilin Flp